MNILDGATGAQGLASSLGTAVTAGGLFDSVTPFIPFVGGIVLFAFGYRVLRKAIKGASKGKANI